MDYFNHVARAVVNLLNEVLKEEGNHFFRKTPQVVLGYSNGDDYALTLGGNVQIEQDKGTFTAFMGEDRFMVFRNPGKITLPFSLAGQGTQSLKAYDRLMSYFFDHRSIDPFVPERFKMYPPLYERLAGYKAELKLREQDSLSADYLSFGFDYSALYHSGNCLREETKTKQRVINLNDSSERRIP